ncbi:hypothetical protein [Kitasatospora acidiphila]|nr:hypothetical protein [Kitasatospora acidiphila]
MPAADHIFAPPGEGLLPSPGHRLPTPEPPALITATVTGWLASVTF